MVVYERHITLGVEVTENPNPPPVDGRAELQAMVSPGNDHPGGFH